MNLAGVFASAVQRDFEAQAHVDLMDPKCIVTTTAQVTTLDLATLSPEDLKLHGVKVCLELIDRFRDLPLFLRGSHFF